MYGDTLFGLILMLMRKIVNNDVSKDSTIMTRIHYSAMVAIVSGKSVIWKLPASSKRKQFTLLFN